MPGDKEGRGVAMTKRILCVDDDAELLEAYSRRLRKRFQIESAFGGEEALAAVLHRGPYAVVVADLRMPGLSGVQLLSKIKVCSPDTVRIMLTGHADLHTALEAVNDGNIFRFLTKPCPVDLLARTLEVSLRQHALVTAERELLNKTLTGIVKVLTDMLGLANPAACGRASRVHNLVMKMCEEMGLVEPWEINVAAMLSQVGCVAISRDTLAKVQRGADLSSEESDTLRNHPRVGRELVQAIPRMEEVAEIIAHQDSLYHRQRPLQKEPFGSSIPLGSRVLKAALDFDELFSRGIAEEDALTTLKDRQGWYDPGVLEVLEKILPGEPLPTRNSTRPCTITEN